jgi:hypothetical protein
MFIDAAGNTFIIVRTSGFRGEYYYSETFLYMNDNLIDLEPYGGIWNQFLKDGHFHFASRKDETVFIYGVEKDVELVSSINIAGSLGKRLTGEDVDRVIPVPGPSNSYCLLACRWNLPVDPVDFAKTVLSAGHGISYWKPFLVEVQEGKLAKPQRLGYGGKIDESYYVKEVVQHGYLVHLLGLRQQEVPGWGSAKKEFESRMLHHAAYDLKKKKVIEANTIFTKAPKIEKDKNSETLYGPLSVDALGNDVFVAFTWVRERLQPRPIPRDEIESSIFYWQHSDGTASDVEKIAEGFLPLLKVDSSGTVHLLRVDKRASLVHKAKRNGKWDKDRVLVKNLDMDNGTIFKKCVSAEFDKNNNLHVVYPLGGDLVHAVVKVN